jgi:hypothetical protein
MCPGRTGAWPSIPVLLSSIAPLSSLQLSMNSVFSSDTYTYSSQQWLDSAVGAETRSMSPNDASDFSSSGGSPQLAHPLAHLQPSQGPIQPSTSPNPTGDDEIIPTAIVIKNIPFNVKRETLLDLIVCILGFLRNEEKLMVMIFFFLLH